MVFSLRATPLTLQEHPSRSTSATLTTQGIPGDGGKVTGVVVHNNTLSTLKNLTAAPVDAEHNYWGTVVFSEIVPKISGSVDWSPWCNSDFTNCTYTWPVHNVTRRTDHQTIQAAVDAASSGDIIQVDAGHISKTW